MIYILYTISWPEPPKHDRQHFSKTGENFLSYPGVSNFSTNQNPVFYRCFQILGLGLGLQKMQKGQARCYCRFFSLRLCRQLGLLCCARCVTMFFFRCYCSCFFSYFFSLCSSYCACSLLLLFVCGRRFFVLTFAVRLLYCLFVLFAFVYFLLCFVCFVLCALFDLLCRFSFCLFAFL